MTLDQTSEKRPGRWHRFGVVVCWWIGIFVAVYMYISTAYPEPSVLEYKAIRAVVAGAAAAFVAFAVLPFLQSSPLTTKLALIFAAASVMFVGIYRLDPARRFILAPDDHVTAFTVCRGEYPGGCGNVDVLVGCGDFNTAVNLRCREPEKAISTQLSVRDGNRCGYTVLQISCRAKIN